MSISIFRRQLHPKLFPTDNPNPHKKSPYLKILLRLPSLNAHIIQKHPFQLQPRYRLPFILLILRNLLKIPIPKPPATLLILLFILVLKPSFNIRKCQRIIKFHETLLNRYPRTSRYSDRTYNYVAVEI